MKAFSKRFYVWFGSVLALFYVVEHLAQLEGWLYVLIVFACILLGAVIQWVLRSAYEAYIALAHISFPQHSPEDLQLFQLWRRVRTYCRATFALSTR